MKVVVHEGAHIPVKNGRRLRTGQKVKIEMEVIETKNGPVLYPVGPISGDGKIIETDPPCP